jgi:hypothetical protein
MGEFFSVELLIPNKGGTISEYCSDPWRRDVLFACQFQNNIPLGQKREMVANKQLQIFYISLRTSKRNPNLWIALETVKELEQKLNMCIWRGGSAVKISFIHRWRNHGVGPDTAWWWHGDGHRTRRS